MKALFLVFGGFQAYNGISKKIRYQINALTKCGINVDACHYEVSEKGERLWMINGQVLVNLGKGIIAKIKKRIFFTSIIRYIQEENITFIYIRSYHNANPFTIYLVKTLKKHGIKIVLEIPTYPYDQEFINQKFNLCIDKFYRHTFCKYIDKIVTFSNDTKIFGQRTIRISNGIDFDSIPLHNRKKTITNELHLIGVAEIHFWHGFDRVIQGLKNYYTNNPDYKVYFHIIGNFSGDRERIEIENPIKENKLQEYIILHGAKQDAELDTLFNQADFAIGSLGRHRSGINNIKTLKNREYAARGFAFIYSETDDDFDHMPYILKAPADETPIDIPSLISFCKNQSMSPKDIRNSIHHLSWNEQMKKVCKEMDLV